ncbi:ABC-2 transporter permease [Eubacterium sp. 1001713B170207_170306_E7]|uniref:ABC-2 transporter permease n=1 Tax=Eubacterium sp. 1001713B170207_170306_E7 TaxID=2787097 RepID=UPI00189BA16D|nr:ABC-2 transporter permease [Eubacterium sp. 1001713B170207_170306_E7]
MKGLIIKEFLGLRRYFRLLSALMVLYIFMAIGMTSISIFSAINAILVMICALSGFSYDSYNHWNEFAMTLPLSRADLVKSKYLFILLLCAFGTVITLILSLAVGLIIHVPMQEIFIGALCSALAALFLGALTTPFIYKFGVEKARYILIIVVMIPTLGFVSFGSYLSGLQLPSAQTLTLLAWCAPALVLAFVFLSYRISRHIFMCQDL